LAEDLRRDKDGSDRESNAIKYGIGKRDIQRKVKDYIDKFPRSETENEKATRQIEKNLYSSLRLTMDTGYDKWRKFFFMDLMSAQNKRIGAYEFFLILRCFYLEKMLVDDKQKQQKERLEYTLWLNKDDHPEQYHDITEKLSRNLSISTEIILMNILRINERMGLWGKEPEVKEETNNEETNNEEINNDKINDKEINVDKTDGKEGNSEEIIIEEKTIGKKKIQGEFIMFLGWANNLQLHIFPYLFAMIQDITDMLTVRKNSCNNVVSQVIQNITNYEGEAEDCSGQRLDVMIKEKKKDEGYAFFGTYHMHGGDKEQARKYWRKRTKGLKEYEWNADLSNDEMDTLKYFVQYVFEQCRQLDEVVHSKLIQII
jgi:hypothetical protein